MSQITLDLTGLETDIPDSSVQNVELDLSGLKTDIDPIEYDEDAKSSLDVQNDWDAVNNSPMLSGPSEVNNEWAKDWTDTFDILNRFDAAWRGEDVPPIPREEIAKDPLGSIKNILAKVGNDFVHVAVGGIVPAIYGLVNFWDEDSVGDFFYDWFEYSTNIATMGGANWAPAFMNFSTISQWGEKKGYTSDVHQNYFSDVLGDFHEAVTKATYYELANSTEETDLTQSLLDLDWEQAKEAINTTIANASDPSWLMNTVPAGVGSILGFAVPFTHIAKAQAGTKAISRLGKFAENMKLRRTSEWLGKKGDKVGNWLDYIVAAFVPGVMESNVESQGIAREVYEANLEKYKKDGMSEEEAIYKAENDASMAASEAFSANMIITTASNLAFGSNLVKGLSGNLGKKVPAVISSFFAEGMQEAWQTGTQKYEMMKYLDPESEDRGFLNVLDLADKTLAGLLTNPDIQQDFLLGGVLGGGTTLAAQGVGKYNNYRVKKRVAPLFISSVKDLYKSVPGSTDLDPVKVEKYMEAMRRTHLNSNMEMMLNLEDSGTEALKEVVNLDGVGMATWSEMERGTDPNSIVNGLTDLLNAKSELGIPEVDIDGKLLSNKEFTKKKTDMVLNYIDTYNMLREGLRREGLDEYQAYTLIDVVAKEKWLTNQRNELQKELDGLNKLKEPTEEGVVPEITNDQEYRVKDLTRRVRDLNASINAYQSVGARINDETFKKNNVRRNNMIERQNAVIRSATETGTYDIEEANLIKKDFADEFPLEVSLFTYDLAKIVEKKEKKTIENNDIPNISNEDYNAGDWFSKKASEELEGLNPVEKKKKRNLINRIDRITRGGGKYIVVKTEEDRDTVFRMLEYAGYNTEEFEVKQTPKQFRIYFGVNRPSKKNPDNVRSEDHVAGNTLENADDTHTEIKSEDGITYDTAGKTGRHYRKMLNVHDKAAILGSLNLVTGDGEMIHAIIDDKIVMNFKANPAIFDWRELAKGTSITMRVVEDARLDVVPMYVNSDNRLEVTALQHREQYEGDDWEVNYRPIELIANIKGMDQVFAYLHTPDFVTENRVSVPEGQTIEDVRNQLIERRAEVIEMGSVETSIVAKHPGVPGRAGTLENPDRKTVSSIPGIQDLEIVAITEIPADKREQIINLQYYEGKKNYNNVPFILLPTTVQRNGVQAYNIFPLYRYNYNDILENDVQPLENQKEKSKDTIKAAFRVYMSRGLFENVKTGKLKEGMSDKAIAIAKRAWSVNEELKDLTGGMNLLAQKSDMYEFLNMFIPTVPINKYFTPMKGERTAWSSINKVWENYAKGSIHEKEDAIADIDKAINAATPNTPNGKGFIAVSNDKFIPVVKGFENQDFRHYSGFGNAYKRDESVDSKLQDLDNIIDNMFETAITNFGKNQIGKVMAFMSVDKDGLPMMTGQSMDFVDWIRSITVTDIRPIEIGQDANNDPIFQYFPQPVIMLDSRYSKIEEKKIDEGFSEDIWNNEDEFRSVKPITTEQSKALREKLEAENIIVHESLGLIGTGKAVDYFYNFIANQLVENESLSEQELTDLIIKDIDETIAKWKIASKNFSKTGKERVNSMIDRLETIKKETIFNPIFDFAITRINADKELFNILEDEQEDRAEKTKGDQYDVSSWEVNQKLTIPKQLRLFFSGVKDMLVDKNGNESYARDPLLGTTVPVSFNVVYDRIKSVLADSSEATKDNLLDILNKNSGSFPWMTQVIERIERLEESQVLNQLLSEMDDAFVNMQFALHSRKRGKRQEKIQVINSNSNELKRFIKRVWKDGIRHAKVFERQLYQDYVAGLDKEGNPNTTESVTKFGFFTVTEQVERLQELTEQWRIADSKERQEILKEVMDLIGIDLGNRLVAEFSTNKGMFRQVAIQDLFSSENSPFKYIVDTIVAMEQTDPGDNNIGKVPVGENATDNPIEAGGSISKLINYYIQYNPKVASLMPTGFRDGQKQLYSFKYHSDITDRMRYLTSSISENYGKIGKGSEYEQNMLDSMYTMESFWLSAFAAREGNYLFSQIARAWKDEKAIDLGVDVFKQAYRKNYQSRKMSQLDDYSQTLVEITFFMNNSKEYEEKTDKRIAKYIMPVVIDNKDTEVAIAGFADKLEFDVSDENLNRGWSFYRPVSTNENWTKLRSSMMQNALLPDLNRMVAYWIHETHFNKNTKEFAKGAKFFYNFPDLNAASLVFKEGEIPLLNWIKTTTHDLMAEGKSHRDIVDLIYNKITHYNTEIAGEAFRRSEPLVADDLNLPNYMNFNEIFLDFIKSEVENKMKLWEEAGILEAYQDKGKKKKYNVNYLEHRYLQSMLGVTKVKYNSIVSKHPRRVVEAFAWDFVTNQFNAASEIRMLFTGDPAHTFKSSHYNSVQESLNAGQSPSLSTVRLMMGQAIGAYQKRLSAAIAPGKKLANNEKEDDYLQLVLQDGVFMSEIIPYYALELDGKYFDKEKYAKLHADLAIANNEVDPTLIEAAEKALENYMSNFPKSSNFLQIEATDSAEMETNKERIFFLWKRGQISKEEKDKLEEFIETKPSYDSLSSKDKLLVSKHLLAPKKPVQTGIKFEKLENTNMLFPREEYIKSASFTLSHFNVSGLQSEKIMKLMEAIEEKTGLNVRASYGSAVKKGQKAAPLSIFDANGDVNIDPDNMSDADLQTIIDNHTVRVPRRNTREQQTIPYKSEKGDELSQIMSQAEKQLFNNMHDLPGFKFRGKEMTGRDLERERDRLYMEIFNRKRSDLFEEMGINEYIDESPWEQLNIYRLAAILKREAVDRNHPIWRIQGLELREDDNFIYPLWASNGAQQFEQLVNSVIKNRIIKRVVPGYGYTITTEQGMRPIEGVPASGLIFLNEGFAKTGRLLPERTFRPSHYSKLNEEERTEYANMFPGVDISKLKKETFFPDQVILPLKWRYKGEIIDPFALGWIIKKDGKNFIDTTKVDPEILKYFGFRIPTSVHVSMSSLEVVAFHNGGADLMYVPKDFTKKSGEDFDADKRYTYHYVYHWVDGRLEKISTPQVESVNMPDDLEGDTIEGATTKQKDGYFWYNDTFYKIEDGIVSKPDQRKLLEGFVFHHGAARGTDLQMGYAGNRLGAKVIAHIFDEYGRDRFGKQDVGAMSGSSHKVITHDQESLEVADEYLEKANQTLERRLNIPEYNLNLLRRNYYQVKDAKMVVAVGEIITTPDSNNMVVNGGTGWAVQMAADMGKPVYVFDQKVGSWFKLKERKLPENLPQPTHTMKMAFKDAERGRKMRKEFVGKSTLQLIVEGKRVATTRTKFDEDLKEGSIIQFYDKSRNILARVTKAPYKVEDITAEEWSKLEGWSEDMYEKNKNRMQIQFEFVAELTDQSTIFERSSVPVLPKGEVATVGTRILNKAGEQAIQSLMIKTVVQDTNTTEELDTYNAWKKSNSVSKINRIYYGEISNIKKRIENITNRYMLRLDEGTLTEPEAIALYNSLSRKKDQAEKHIDLNNETIKEIRTKIAIYKRGKSIRLDEEFTNQEDPVEFAKLKIKQIQKQTRQLRKESATAALKKRVEKLFPVVKTAKDNSPLSRFIIELDQTYRQMFRAKRNIRDISPEEYATLSYEQKLTDDQLTNELLDVRFAVTDNPSMFVRNQFIEPLSTEIAETTADVLEKKKIDEELESKYVPYSPLTSTYQQDMRKSKASGKGGTGVYSLDISFHPYLQKFYGVVGVDKRQSVVVNVQRFILNEEGEWEKQRSRRLPVDIGGISGNMVLGRKRTLDGGRFVSDIHKEAQNISVDNGTLQAMDKLNLNSQTYNASSSMNMAGADQIEIEYDGQVHNLNLYGVLFNQPIVKEFTRRVEIEKGSLGKRSGSLKQKELEIIDELVERYSDGLEMDENWLREYRERVSSISAQNLFNMAHKSSLNFENITSAEPGDRRNQIYLLYYFYQHHMIGNKIRSFQNAINVDGGKKIDKSLTVNSESKDFLIRNLGYRTNVGVISGEDWYDEIYITNMNNLVGDAAYWGDIDHYRSLLNLGYVPFDWDKKIMIRPSTISSNAAVHALGTTSAMWRKHFPYNTIGVNAVTDLILSEMGQDPNESTVSTKASMKQEIFDNLKSFLIANRMVQQLLPGVSTREARNMIFEGKKTQVVLPLVKPVNELDEDDVPVLSSTIPDKYKPKIYRKGYNRSTGLWYFPVEDTGYMGTFKIGKKGLESQIRALFAHAESNPEKTYHIYSNDFIAESSMEDVDEWAALFAEQQIPVNVRFDETMKGLVEQYSVRRNALSLANYVQNNIDTLKRLKYTFFRNPALNVLNSDNVDVIQWQSSGTQDDTEPLYWEFMQMFTDDTALPNWGDEAMTVSRLAQYMALHENMRGGNQEAREFVRFISPYYYQEMGISDILHNINWDNLWDFGIEETTGLKGFIKQYFQHNPINTKAKFVNWKRDSKYVSNPATFARDMKIMKLSPEGIEAFKKDEIITSEGTIPITYDFISFYDFKLKKVLLWVQTKDEYNYELVDTYQYEPIHQYNSEEVITTGVGEEARIEDEFNISVGRHRDQSLLYSIIGSSDTWISLLAERVYSVVQRMAKQPVIIVDESLDNTTYAKYDRDTSTIYINYKLLGNDPEKAQKKILHEYLHHILHQVLTESVVTDKDGNITGLRKEGDKLDPILKRLWEAYTQMNEVLRERYPDFDKVKETYNLTKMLIHKEGDSMYGGFNIHEFVSEMMTNEFFQIEAATTEFKGEARVSSLWEKIKGIFLDLIKTLTDMFGVDTVKNNILEISVMDIFDLIEDSHTYDKPPIEKDSRELDASDYMPTLTQEFKDKTGIEGKTTDDYSDWDSPVSVTLSEFYKIATEEQIRKLHQLREAGIIERINCN